MSQECGSRSSALPCWFTSGSQQSIHSRGHGCVQKGAQTVSPQTLGIHRVGSAWAHDPEHSHGSAHAWRPCKTKHWVCEEKFPLPPSPSSYSETQPKASRPPDDFTCPSQGRGRDGHTQYLLAWSLYCSPSNLYNLSELGGRRRLRLREGNDRGCETKQDSHHRHS